MVSHHEALPSRYAGRVLAVQRAAYAVEAALVGDDRIPALHEDLTSLQARPLRWLLADEPTVSGALGYERTDTTATIDRLVVDPARARRGVGRALVEELLRRTGETPVHVSTGRDNTPARRLYERLGFHRLGDREVLTGLWVTDYRSSPDPRPPASGAVGLVDDR
ncbi:GNAT family N-acetyltransferase [Phycicoccus avicenniae]|uniref:GNAT family N-acetyltransferase n=1 Tax=Phycicoccus avicenniae TaxID=2828860 RepID=UPI003D2C6D3C